MSPITELIGGVKSYGWGAFGFPPIATMGVLVGGDDYGSDNPHKEMQGLKFSTETMIYQGSMTVKRFASCVTMNPSSSGYISGGNQPSGNTAEKLTFITSTTASLGTNWLPTTQTSWSYPNCHNGSTAGYFAGGNGSGGNVSAIRKVTFSNDTVSLLGATLSSAREGGSALSYSTTAGYLCSGRSTGNESTVQKITFSNDTISTSTSQDGTHHNPSGIVNGTTNGYTAGGADGYGWEKFTFSNETWTVVCSSNQCDGGYYFGGPRGLYNTNGGATYGYTAGGIAQNQGNSSRAVAKIQFSNDSISLVGLNKLLYGSFGGSPLNAA